MEYSINGVLIADSSVVEYTNDKGETSVAHIRAIRPDGTADLEIHLDNVSCSDTGEPNTWAANKITKPEQQEEETPAPESTQSEAVSSEPVAPSPEPEPSEPVTEPTSEDPAN